MQKREKIIYIAGKYTGPEVLMNIHKAKMAAQSVWEAGFTAFCPHLNSGMFASTKLKYRDYMDGDTVILTFCSGIYMLEGWEQSKGAKEEKEYAELLEIPIFYSVEEIIDYFRK